MRGLLQLAAFGCGSLVPATAAERNDGRVFPGRFFGPVQPAFVQILGRPDAGHAGHHDALKSLLSSLHAVVIERGGARNQGGGGGGSHSTVSCTVGGWPVQASEQHAADWSAGSRRTGWTSRQARSRLRKEPPASGGAASRLRCR